MSLSENLDTSAPAGRTLFTVLGADAELERSLIIGKRPVKPPSNVWRMILLVVPARKRNLGLPGLMFSWFTAKYLDLLHILN